MYNLQQPSNEISLFQQLLIEHTKDRPLLNFIFGFVITLTVIGILIGAFWDCAWEAIEPSERRGTKPPLDPLDLILTMASFLHAVFGGVTGCLGALWLSGPLLEVELTLRDPKTVTAPTPTGS